MSFVVVESCVFCRSCAVRCFVLCGSILMSLLHSLEVGPRCSMGGAKSYTFWSISICALHSLVTVLPADGVFRGSAWAVASGVAFWGVCVSR